MSTTSLANLANEPCGKSTARFESAPESFAILALTAAWLEEQADEVEGIGVEQPDVYELSRRCASKMRREAHHLRQIVLERKGASHAA